MYKSRNYKGRHKLCNIIAWFVVTYFANNDEIIRLTFKKMEYKKIKKVKIKDKNLKDRWIFIIFLKIVIIIKNNINVFYLRKISLFI